MGNRAVITTRKNWENDGVGIYLHWNGGRDSVEAFLKYCELKGFRSPSQDSYGWARLCQVIGNFFGGGLSVGIDTIWHLDRDNGDNGVYIIEGWEIVDRYYFDRAEQIGYDMNEMLLAIDEAQPQNEQIRDFLIAEDIDIGDIKKGDKIAYIDWNGRIAHGEVIGISKRTTALTGQDVFGFPYIDAYGVNPEGNICNYLKKGIKTFRRVKDDVADE